MIDGPLNISTLEKFEMGVHRLHPGQIAHPFSGMVPIQMDQLPADPSLFLEYEKYSAQSGTWRPWEWTWTFSTNA